MFCYPEEKSVGLIFPDTMYVYNQKVKDMLRPIYDTTSFFLGCSSRYAHWKNAEIKNGQNKFYLFVTALPEFDIETVLGAIASILVTSKFPINLRLRLHPQAILSGKVRKNLNNLVSKGLLEISKETTLKEDIENSIAVIGMSSTALEEALLLNRPVIKLYHEDYLSYVDIDGIEGAVKKDYSRLRVDDLEDVAKLKIDSGKIRDSLGLNNPEVVYEELFRHQADAKAKVYIDA